MEFVEEPVERMDESPAYQKLARTLHNQFMEGKLRPGDRLPPELEICETFGLSRITVRQALAILVEQGLLRREQGRGTFVVGPRVDGGVFVIPDFYEEMRLRGRPTIAPLITAKLVMITSIPAEKLGIVQGEPAIYLERVLSGEDEPLVFDRKYILYNPARPLLEAELGEGSITDLFREFPDWLPVKSDLYLTVTTLSSREAELLQSTPGKPAFCIEQLVWAANDLRVAWGWMVYRGDRFGFPSMTRPI